MRYASICSGVSPHSKALAAFGMAMRNFLRSKGFGEKEMGVDNLDDIYVELIEAAVKK